MTTSTDASWMLRALELAERGRGHVEPNPLVGAVIVHEGQVVGEGWHQRYGGPHAEVHALQQAGERARGATLYVTLEPCCHHGKTPPCTDAVRAAGIARVVAAMADPFPRVSGQGDAILQAAGIRVQMGLEQERARRLNAPYLKLLSAGYPYVHAKWAMTLDGKIATATGHSKWISNETSRRRVHQLRGCMDGILVGLGTALADDPHLTVRPPGPRIPTRIVLDTQARLPLAAYLVQTAREVPTLVVVDEGLPPERTTGLEDAGCEVLRVSTTAGRPSVLALLAELGRRRFTNVLVEGGSGVLGSFRDANLIDQVHVFIAPRLAGGARSLSPVGGQGVASMAEALPLQETQIEVLDGDLYVRGQLLAVG